MHLPLNASRMKASWILTLQLHRQIWVLTSPNFHLGDLLPETGQVDTIPEKGNMLLQLAAIYEQIHLNNSCGDCNLISRPVVCFHEVKWWKWVQCMHWVEETMWFGASKNKISHNISHRLLILATVNVLIRSLLECSCSIFYTHISCNRFSYSKPFSFSLFSAVRDHLHH